MKKAKIIKYIDGDISEKDAQDVLNWISKNKRNERYYFFLKNLWTLSAISDDSGSIAVKNHNSYKAGVFGSRTIFHNMKTVVAASLAGILIVSSIFVLYDRVHLFDKVGLSNNNSIVVRADTDNLKVLNMADGSRVILNNGAKLSYSETFGISDRDIWVEGEALFEVAKNDCLPMIISTPSGEKVRVVGTKFIVNTAFKEDLFSTYLIEGKVRVFVPSAGYVGDYKEVDLVEDEMITVSKDRKIRVEMVSEDSSILEWKNNWLCFENQPLHIVLDRLAEYYGVKFIYSEKIGEIQLTISIMDDSIEDFLTIIDACVGVKSKIDKKIITLF